MFVLVAFAFIAGAGTAVSPCVLPVLPALLSASAMGGRRRPFGIVIGLAVTFTVAVAGLATLVGSVGVADGFLRTFAIAVLVVFGLALVVPRAADRIEAFISARTSRFAPASKGDGFRSGVAVGGALGFVYAPCAGPILAAVISVGASQGASWRLVAIALAYGVGSAAVLLILALGGRRLTERVRRAGRGPMLQRVVGVVMVVTAILMAADLDVRFQTALANNLPDFVTNPTSSLERSDTVRDRLDDLRKRPSRFGSGTQATAGAGGQVRLPVLGRAPDFTGNQRWFNTPGGRSLDLESLRGRVVLIDFWTYTCIDCIRTLPEVRGLDRRYRRSGLTVVGVHTPEFAFERKASNVQDAIAQNRLRYPVAQDNEYRTWDAWQNQYWPAKYLIDARGNVRYVHFGGGDEEKTEQAVRTLLAEAGARDLGATAPTKTELAAAGVTPESYLGFERAERFVPEPVRDGERGYHGARRLPLHMLSLDGRWRISGEAATAVRRASIDLSFRARKVFLVMSSVGERPRQVRVLLDGRPIAQAQGEDVRDGAVTVSGQRLYRLVSLPGVERHRLTLETPPGVSGFAFTFG